MRRLAVGLLLAAALGACGSKSHPRKVVSAESCEPRPPATNKALGSEPPYQEQAGQWVVGKRPVFVWGPRFARSMPIVAPRVEGTLVQSLRGLGRGTGSAARAKGTGSYVRA
jgi:hypothetical protein